MLSFTLGKQNGKVCVFTPSEGTTKYVYVILWEKTRFGLKQFHDAGCFFLSHFLGYVTLSWAHWHTAAAIPSARGMVWRSHLVHGGLRRANYYIKHLLVNLAASISRQSHQTWSKWRSKSLRLAGKIHEPHGSTWQHDGFWIAMFDDTLLKVGRIQFHWCKCEVYSTNDIQWQSRDQAWTFHGNLEKWWQSQIWSINFHVKVGGRWNSHLGSPFSCGKFLFSTQLENIQQS